MTDIPIVAVIMAGGSGKRFWPLSSVDQPKQFLRVSGDRSMIQATWQRLDGLVPPERRLVITGAAQAAQVREHLPDIDPDNLIGEPMQRDTAAAAILGAALAERKWPGAVVVTLPADHLIGPDDAFRSLVARAAEMVARERALGTIGIAPLYPADCYGYIERSDPLPIGGHLKAFRVRRFAEKPKVATATEYLRSGAFYWNAGIFLWSAEVLLEEASQFLSDHHARLTGAATVWRTPGWSAALTQAYDGLRKISIDYGIMEHTRRAAVVEATFSWSDLGGWIALSELLAADAGGNRVRGRTLLQDCRGNVVYNTDDAKPVLCVGLTDLVIAHTAHGVLICPKDRLEQIRQAVDQLFG
jgi:mannose-1-phosphate guanylyltransferase